jgi:clan AA aspartic protease
MGLVHADIELRSLTNLKLEPLVVTSLVDSGALHLCIPEHVAIQLGLDCNTADQREVMIASGERKLCPYVGPLQITFKNRKCFSGALVLGNEVLLGAIPMEDMDLVIHPAKRALLPNPESPNVPVSTVK